MQQTEVPLLLLCGAPGAGKSSVAWEVYWRLVREGAQVAHVDLDGLGYGPPGHSRSFELKLRNVASLWRNHSAAGASAFVVSGLRALEEDVLGCVAAVPGAVPTPVVLAVTAEEQRKRLLLRATTRYAAGRGGGSSMQTPEALDRFVTEARQQLDEMDEIRNALVVETSDETVVDIARQLLLATGWPGSVSRARTAEG